MKNHLRKKIFVKVGEEEKEEEEEKEGSGKVPNPKSGTKKK